MTHTTPLEIEILLHYYYSPYQYEGLEYDAQSYAAARLASMGLLIETEEGYTGDPEALKLYVDALTSVPLPVRVWAIKNPTK